MDRSSQIIKTSIVGIVANVLLAVFKAVVGILASSVAIVMDAVNNLSDALSSVITIVGTRLSQRPADRQHPFGFGRIVNSLCWRGIQLATHQEPWRLSAFTIRAWRRQSCTENP